MFGQTIKYLTVIIVLLALWQSDSARLPVIELYADLLQTNQHTQQQAQDLFFEYCSECHGPHGRGDLGFPNLTDGSWQYKHSLLDVYQTIRDGRFADMPNFQQLLSDSEIRHIVRYVNSSKSNPKPLISKGYQLFARHCSHCHGAQAQGMPHLGAPNLTDKTTLWGDKQEDILSTIRLGSNGWMPGHAHLLSPTDIALLSAYVLEFSRQ